MPLKSLSFAFKVYLNIHDLNNEANVGNFIDIRTILILNEKGEPEEVPSVSGRMLKHWHCENMRQLILSEEYGEKYGGIRLCPACYEGEPARPGVINSATGELIQVVKPEEDVIRECAICDIHGYLVAVSESSSKPKKKKEESEEEEVAVEEREEKTEEGKDEKVKTIRRTSRVYFSWLVPVLDVRPVYKSVIHTRVAQIGKVEKSNKKSESETDTAQMLFNKSYASGLYAMVSTLQVDRIGLYRFGMDKRYVVDEEERKKRIKVAIEAYRFLLTGQMGASLSHAYPHVKPVEVLVCYSETGPVPVPVSPMYPDYLTITTGLMPEGTRILYWGEGKPEGVIKKSTLNEIFDELFEKVG